MGCGLRVAGGRTRSTHKLQWVLGFTLIELTLVIVTLAIVLLAATPRLQQTAQRLRAEQAATELAQLMRMAHEQAVASGEETVWTWDAASHRARVERVSEEQNDASKSAASPTPMLIMQSAPVPEGIAIDVTRTEEPLDCWCVHFFPEGTSENVTLTVRLSEHTFTATVDEATSQVNFASRNSTYEK